ncbi:mycofactocin-coupled SDR family oxidoreductase [Rhodococcus sp. G-MC3]|uniref:mycofactocin-coupled SDR family oxidoreductase n=1 Tax=Rhodococcus sp. G-MC3 TaxID=3046209 RepID=UPI0024B89795|nr:mycofactocin-coupled SDR family oxidoreductase [Rhodococcus sp. G-MC3]MDJ0394874.1 mycofactocin-coupled SDR family oxidoreductase [Rhodococcus sp. G-MC3]
MTGRLSNTVALVTGAAKGMGRSHCLRLAEEGADIIGLDLGEAASMLAETADLVHGTGQRCHTELADVRDQHETTAAVLAGVTELGGLDTVVANAGIYSDLTTSWELEDSAWKRTLDVNLTGVWHTVKAAEPHLTTGGSIIVISSTNGIKGTARTSHYSASKHALIGLARSLANELGPRMIRVNTVLPGAVGTEMILNTDVFANLRPDLSHPAQADAAFALMAKHLLPVPWLEPIDVSNAVLFLASHESRFITGAQLVVDAGLTEKVT